MSRVGRASSGFVYYVSRTGVTGALPPPLGPGPGRQAPPQAPRPPWRSGSACRRRPRWRRSGRSRRRGRGQRPGAADRGESRQSGLASLLENRVHELSAPLHRGAERKRDDPRVPDRGAGPRPYLLEVPAEAEGFPSGGIPRLRRECRAAPGGAAPDPRRLRFVLCAVQPLHPFYNKSGEVIACWMTVSTGTGDRGQRPLRGQRRLPVRQDLPVSERLVYLGVLAGAAMAYRAAAGAGHPARGLVVLGGDCACRSSSSSTSPASRRCSSGAAAARSGTTPPRWSTTSSSCAPKGGRAAADLPGRPRVDRRVPRRQGSSCAR